MDLLLNLFFGRKNHDFVSGRISIEIVSSIKRVFTFFSIWKKIGKMVLNATSENNIKQDKVNSADSAFILLII